MRPASPKAIFKSYPRINYRKIKYNYPCSLRTVIASDKCNNAISLTSLGDKMINSF